MPALNFAVNGQLTNQEPPQAGSPVALAVNTSMPHLNQGKVVNFKSLMLCLCDAQTGNSGDDPESVGQHTSGEPIKDSADSQNSLTTSLSGAFQQVVPVPVAITSKFELTGSVLPELSVDGQAGDVLVSQVDGKPNPTYSNKQNSLFVNSGVAESIKIVPGNGFAMQVAGNGSSQTSPASVTATASALESVPNQMFAPGDESADPIQSDISLKSNTVFDPEKSLPVEQGPPSKNFESATFKQTGDRQLQNHEPVPESVDRPDLKTGSSTKPTTESIDKAASQIVGTTKNEIPSVTIEGSVPNSLPDTRPRTGPGTPVVEVSLGPLDTQLEFTGKDPVAIHEASKSLDAPSKQKTGKIDRLRANDGNLRPAGFVSDQLTLEFESSKSTISLNQSQAEIQTTATELSQQKVRSTNATHLPATEQTASVSVLVEAKPQGKEPKNKTLAFTAPKADEYRPGVESGRSASAVPVIGQDARPQTDPIIVTPDFDSPGNSESGSQDSSVQLVTPDKLSTPHPLDPAITPVLSPITVDDASIGISRLFMHQARPATAAVGPYATNDIDPVQVLHQISSSPGVREGLEKISLVDESTVRIELRPSSLGDVTVEIRRTESVIKVHIVADRAHTHAVLERNITSLIQSFHDQGGSAFDVDVSHRQSNQHQQQSEQKQAMPGFNRSQVAHEVHAGKSSRSSLSTNSVDMIV